MLIFLTFSFFPSCGRIKLHLLQVLHHRRKHCDVSEDNTEEWVRASLNCCPTLSAHSSISCSTSRCLLLFLLHQSVLVFVLSAAVSHHLLAALFQAGHCLISECLRSVLPTLCSSISKLPSNISFYWRIHNIETSGTNIGGNTGVPLYKSHHLLVPRGKKEAI